MLKPVIIGATASSKTSVAVCLSKLLSKSFQDAQIVNADAFQMYKDMDIGTAKPSLKEQSGVVHHLMSVIPASENSNVGVWMEMADKVIRDLENKSILPIVAGGSHMYINTFMHETLSVEDSLTDDAAVQLAKKLEGYPAEMLWNKLKVVDPVLHDTLHVNDVKRVIRGIVVFQQTGKRLSELQVQWKKPWRNDACLIVLDVDKASLHKRIDRRVDNMMHMGLEEEVYRLWQNKALSTTAKMAIGYREFYEYFERPQDISSIQNVFDLIKLHTRQYSNRQQSWIRKIASKHPERVIRIPLHVPNHDDEHLALNMSSQSIAEIIATQYLDLCKF